jgi:hypothetical protein
LFGIIWLNGVNSTFVAFNQRIWTIEDLISNSVGIPLDAWKRFPADDGRG